MNTTPQASKSDVLHAFLIEANPNADTLTRYLKLYPQYRESLIEASIELYSAPSFDKVPVEAAPSENAKHAWSRFQSMLNVTDPASLAVNIVANPLSSLSDQRFRELAGELNINRLFLSRLRDCSIQVTTIPKRFLLSLADALTVTIEQLQNALDASPTVASGQRYKASGKPSATDKITFEEALIQSGLTEEQQALLRGMKD